MVRRSWLLALCVACGVDVVELSPGGGSLLVIGEIPPDAIRRLRADDKAPDPKMLTLTYPPEGAVLPENLAPIRFAWEDKPMGTYELSLVAGTRTLQVYTRDHQVVLPAEAWSALLEASELRVQLSALEDGGKRMVRRGEPRLLAVRPALQGALYLAAPTQAERARISDTTSTPNDQRERALGAVLGEQTARPGVSRVELSDRTLQVPAGGRVAHPSWAPDGSALVLTYWPPELALADDPSDQHEGSTLAQLTLAGAFSALTIEGAMSPRRPRYSPDGRWLAFEGGKLDAPELFVVAAEGGMARRVACGMPMMGKSGDGAPAWLGNSWLGFVSSRPYADPAHAQVWFAELSPDELRCSAPLWLPAQDGGHDYEALWFERD